MIPRPAAREIPATIAIGAARMSGHGVATTSTARARTGSPDRSQAPPAIPNVSGRKSRAKRSARRTNGAFEEAAEATSRMIPAYVLASALARLIRSKGPPALTVPDAIWSPA